MKLILESNIDSFYFIVKGKAFSELSFQIGEQTLDYETIDLQAIADWRLAQDANLILKKFSYLVDFLIVR